MRLLKNSKIYDDEHCPCGSERNCFECCKYRKDQTRANNQKPPEIQIMEQMRKSLFKCCLYPDETRCVKHIK